MSEHTKGPWAWFGNANSNHIYLATTHSGRLYVMDFVRWGMHGAQPRFQPTGEGMVDAKHLLKFAVGDKDVVGIDAARMNGSVYRLDIEGIDHPDARLIAAAPDVLEALKAVMRVADRHTAEFDMARAAIAKAEGRSDA